MGTMTNTASRKPFWISSVSTESPVRKNKQMDQTTAPTPALRLDRFEMLVIVGGCKKAVEVMMFGLPKIFLRKENAVGFSIEFCQQLLYKPRLHASGFLRMNQVAHDRFKPGIFANAKHNYRTLLDL